jgi:hypothetical protein
MNYIKVWDWKYKVFFDSSLKSELLNYSKKLKPNEATILLKIIDHFKSFYSFGMLLDYLTEHPTKADETFNLALKNKHKLLYMPDKLYDYYLTQLNSGKLSQKDELEELLNYANKNGQVLLNHSNHFKIIFGSYYDKIIARYEFFNKQNITPHKSNLITLNKPENEVKKYLTKISSTKSIVNDFGKNILPDYTIEVKDEDGYGEWWDKEVSDLERSKLIIYKNSFALNEYDFEYTIYHEVYPGHGHYYARTKQNNNKSFDNGAMFLIEGYATFVEWNSIKNSYTNNLRISACKYLKTVMEPNFKNAIDNFIANNKTMDKNLLTSKLIRLSQYPLFQESYYLGALLIEIMLENKLFENANEFLEFLNNNNCGEFFALWVKEKEG